MSKRSRGVRRVFERRWTEERKNREKVTDAIAVALAPLEPCPEEIPQKERGGA